MAELFAEKLIDEEKPISNALNSSEEAQLLLSLSKRCDPFLRRFKAVLCVEHLKHGVNGYHDSIPVPTMNALTSPK